MRIARFFRLSPWFAVFVILPVVVAAAYYCLVASDQFVSESRFVVKGRSDRPSQLSGLAGLVQATGLSNGQEQTNEVLDFVKSRNALAELQKRINVRASYNTPRADFLSRFPAFWRSDRFEYLYLFYQNMVSTRIDTETGLAVLDVRAFSAAEAQRINATLLDLSEGLVNRLNAKAREKAITEAEERVTSAQARVRRARLAMGQFRNSQEVIDPIKQAVGVLAISDKLITERAALQAQLELMRQLAPRNPSIGALSQRIAALDRAIASQNGRAVGTKSGISSKLGGYENLALEQEFAAQTLTASSASLEQARVDAQRQQYYLERVVEPNAPDVSRYPERLFRILTIAGVVLCLYLIGWMLIVGILEHAPDD